MAKSIMPLLMQRLEKAGLKIVLADLIAKEFHSYGMVLDWLRKEHPNILNGLEPIKRDSFGVFCKRHGLIVNSVEYNRRPNIWKLQYRYSRAKIRAMAQDGQEKAIYKRRVAGWTNSKQSIEYWLKESNGDANLATQRLTSFKRSNSPKCPEFWIRKGFSLKEAHDRISHDAITGALASLRKASKPKTEEKVAALLAATGIRFSQQYVLKNTIGLDSRKRLVFDFFLPDYETLVEVNGTYWHCDPRIFKETDVVQFPGKQPKTAKDVWARDKAKLQVATTQNYKTITLWEKDLNIWTPEQLMAALAL